jgi:predicted ribosome quality control (RQC) complex YloA/Tae2 family protein
VVPKETKTDAAALAVHYSKARGEKMVKVGLCRVEDVANGKATGQVYLDGDVIHLTMFPNKEKNRLEKLFSQMPPQ